MIFRDIYSYSIFTPEFVWSYLLLVAPRLITLINYINLAITFSFCCTNINIHACSA